MSVTIYHNPKCSKSRQTLALLEQNGIAPRIVRYLDTPPDPGQLTGLLARLGRTPRELLRTGEARYRELGLDDSALSDEDLIAAMCANPILIERPIVVNGKQARVGRPPDAVLDIL